MALRNSFLGSVALGLVVALGALACGSAAEPAAPPPAVRTAATVQPAAASARTAPAARVEQPTAAAQSTVAASPPLARATEVSPTAVAAESAATPSPAPSPAPTTAPAVAAAAARDPDAPLAADLAGITGWINSDPFTLESRRGQVVLVDFWTYTCINCIRTLPYLKEWHDKYSDEGLVIVGVHTPEFEFEKVKENVVKAVGEFGIEYAVAQDNDFATWRAYENRYWPAKYLLDKDGYIRYTHFGEGAYAETEQKIRELLSETGASVFNISLNEEPAASIHPAVRSADQSNAPTRELYAGYERNYSTLRGGSVPPYIAHAPFYEAPDKETLYEDFAVGDYRNQFVYLQGLWRNGSESLVHARVTENYEDYLAVRFYATTVNVVMSPEGGDPYQVRVTLGDQPVDSSNTGADIKFDDEGNSYVLVDEPRMYNLLMLPDYDGHVLKISSNSDNFSVYAYTFGVYETQTDS